MIGPKLVRLLGAISLLQLGTLSMGEAGPKPPQKGGAAPQTPAPPPVVAPPPAASIDESFCGILFKLPQGFTQKDQSTQTARSPIPDNPPTTEQFRSYQDAQGHGLYLYCWDGPPIFDRGPMTTEEEWKVTAGGEPASAALTKMFFGKAQRVATAHFSGPGKKFRYMMYSTLVDKAFINTLLASLHFGTPALSPPPAPVAPLPPT